MKLKNENTHGHHRHNRLPKHTLIFVGFGGVGKSAIINRFLNNSFVEKYTPTRGDTFTTKIAIDSSKECICEILDTAGQEEYAAIRDNYYRSGDGFVAVFGIDERASWTALSVSGIRDQICRALNDDQPTMVLVGNKADLAASRQVTRQEAEELAAKWGNCVYIEASAKFGQGVDDIFQTALRMVDKRKAKLSESKNANTAIAASVRIDGNNNHRNTKCCSVS